MAHAKIQLNITPEWVRARAELEPESGITSAGGLALRWNALRASTPHDAVRHSLAKFVEFSRRRMRLTLEQLAQQADIDLSELYGIESGEEIVPQPRSIYQLAIVLKINPERLTELAGLVDVKDSRMGEVAIRFAARSEPMNVLSPEEEEALNWFLKEMSK